MKHKNIATRYKGLSFSTAATKISKKYPDRDTNAISMRSFLAETDELIKLQEVMRAKEISMESIAKNKRPFKASKFEFGGELWQQAGNLVSSGLPGIPVSPNINWLAQQHQQPNSPVQPVPTIPTLNNGVNPYATAKTGAMNTPLTPLATKMPTSVQSQDNLTFGNNPQSITGTSTDSNPFTPPTKRSNIYTPVAIGKGLEFAGKAFMVADGYDKVAPQYNPYESDIRRTMQSRGINMDAIKQQLLSGQNRGIDASSNIRNESTRQALNNATIRGSSNALANVSMQEQQLSNQYAADYASTLNNLGGQRVQANNYAENLNNQSKAGYQMGLQNVLESVGGAGQEVTNLRASMRQQGLLSEVLKTKNFELTNAEDVIKRMSAGEDIKLSDMISIVTSQGGTQEDATKLFTEFKTKILKK